MKIKTAVFDKSSQTYEDCPDQEILEYAFIGRSNVGKSSLINMLTNQKKLAKTSGTPGKTQLINHFLVNKEWFLVDLPGYGYARVSKTSRQKFSSLIEGYLLNRKNLINVFVLIDCRHSPQKIDLEFMEWLSENSIPFSIVFTKSDKLKSSALKKSIEFYKKKMLEAWEEMPKNFITSSENSKGKEDVLEYIEVLNNSIELL